MKSLLKSVLISLGLILSFTGVSYATTLPDYTPATFETYLSSQQAVSDTTMILSKGTLNDGQLLSGYQCFVVDSSSPSQEYECGTVSSASASGAIVSNVIRGLDYLAGTSTEASQTFLHRRGADVKVSDFPILNYLTRIFNGSDSATSPLNGVYATASSTFVTNGRLNDVAIAGLNTSQLSKNSLVSWTGSIFTATGTNMLTVANLTATGTILVNEYVLATSSNMTLSLATSSSQDVRMGGGSMNITLQNASPGAILRAMVCNPTGSAGTLTWAATSPLWIHWSGTTVPTQTTTANACDMWTFSATNGTSTTFIFGSQVPW